MDAGSVVHVSEGKIKACVQHIRDHLEAKGAPHEQIQQASMDLFLYELDPLAKIQEGTILADHKFIVTTQDSL